MTLVYFLSRTALPVLFFFYFSICSTSFLFSFLYVTKSEIYTGFSGVVGAKTLSGYSQKFFVVVFNHPVILHIFCAILKQC